MSYLQQIAGLASIFYPEYLLETFKEVFVLIIKKGETLNYYENTFLYIF